MLKFLEAGIIYSISDDQWVSPIYVVPMKGGGTLFKHKKSEFVAKRVDTCC